MTSLNLPHYRTFLVLSNMSVSVLIKAVIRSDGLSMAPAVAIAVGIFQYFFHPNPGGLNLAGDYKR